MEEMRKINTVLVGKHEGKSLFESSEHRWKAIMKTDIKDNWVRLAQGRVVFREC
jgi:hypothetical protein